MSASPSPGAAGSGLPAPDIVLTGRFEPGQERRYAHVPFEVPPGVRQLHLRYDYTDRVSSDPSLVGGNTLDIGLFDERGAAPGSPGFRGWSGSNKLQFTIDRDWATPPYRPGPPGAGTWHVLLGPYKIGPRGLHYRVEIWLNPGLAAEPRATLPAPPRARPPAAAPGWVRGELHCHSRYSDGDSWPADLVLRAAELGLDFIAITDHNGIGAHVVPGELPDGDRWPVVLPGVEVTTYRGHWNVWGLPRWFEFREPTEAAISRAMAEAAEAGGVVSVSHPRPLGPPWEYDDTARGYHAVEVWNGPWHRMNATSLAYWEAQLARGARTAAVGGSDTHHLHPSPGALLPPRIGEPTNWLRLDPSEFERGRPTQAGLLRALRRGDGFVTASPTGPRVFLEPSAGGALVRVQGGRGAALLALSAEGCVAALPVSAQDWEAPLHLPAGTHYVRAQLVDRTGTVQTLTNPLWL